MILEPYLVKLFNKRWYALVKSSKPNSDLFTLAFDRILSLEITNEKFCYDKDFDSATWFRDCYGIVNDTNVKVEKVIVRAFGREANYLRDLPFHHSQKEILKEDDYSDFELILRPTADFWTPLLSRGAAIKVLQPQWLADEIKQIHQEAARLYE
jgi:predicted DNA-binding transcriptional regulator YafY